ncbi:MAG: Ig-like domain-containing protein [Casimicrobiaceae bacterium]
MIRRLLVCLLALTGVLCSPVAAARSVWLFESGALTRMDLDTGSVRSIAFSQRPRAISASNGTGAWLLTDEALVLIDEDLAERLRVKLDFSPVAGGTKLAADASSGGVWLAQETRLMNFDTHGVLVGEWSVATPVRAMVVDGPEAIFIATDFALTRYDAAGASLARIDLTQMAGSGAESLLSDASAAYLWLARTGALVQFDVLAGIVPGIVIPTDNPVALSLDTQTGSLTALAGQSIARYDRDAQRQPSAPFAEESVVDVVGIAASDATPYFWFGDRSGVGTIEIASGMVRRVPQIGAVSHFISASGESADHAVAMDANPPVTVALTAPNNDASFTAPASVTLTATATASAGTISFVHFLVNGGIVGTATSVPYTIVWNVARPGTYTLTAWATDSLWASASSPPVNVHVSINAAPTVALSAPANNATFTAPADIELAATASDSDGTVATVEFFVNDYFLGSDDTAPYTFNWNVAGTGTYTLTARAADNTGNWTASAPVTVTITRAAPIVAITSPSHDSLFVAPATIAINADAAKPGGAITRVNFYRDTTYLGTATTPPYSVMWRETVVGTYALTVRAFDGLGQSATSLPVTVGVSALPGSQPTWVDMTAPTANASFLAAPLTTIELEAEAVHPTGVAVTQVKFFYAPNSGNPRFIAAVSAPPYRVAWTPPDLSRGQSYILWVEAIDASGTVTPSRGVPITLVADNPPFIWKLAPHAANGPVVLTAPATVVFVGKVFDDEGTNGAGSLQRVDFVVDDNVVDTLTTANGSDGEFVFTHRDVPVGTRRYTLKAVDTLGSTAISPTTIVHVVAANAPPTALLSAPTSGQTYVAPAAVALEATVTDPDGTIAKVEYLNGATVVATSTAPPFNAIWENAADGSYTITARATDDRGASTVSPAAYVRVLGTSSAPLVALTAPAICGSVSNATPITVAAEVISPSSTITKVEFFAGANLIGTVTADPFAVTWANPTVGNTNLTAKAYDALGQVTTSAPFPISVIGSNQPPTISLIAPTDGQEFPVGQPITLIAIAADVDGTVNVVEFFAGVTLVGSAATAPYSVVWSGAISGFHALTAKATDNTGATSTTPALTVTVAAPNQAPDIALTSPANGQSFAVGQPIMLTASAADGDGAVSKVEFFNGASLLGAVRAPPYAWQWDGAALGTYTLTAKATDDRGVSATSANIRIQVVAGSESTLTMTSPAPNAIIAADFVLVRGTYQAPPNSGVTINGTVAHNDGQGQFFVNNLPLVEGENSITATLTMADGQIQTRSWIVTRSGTAPFQIVAEPDTGFGPFTTTLRVNNRSTNLIAEFSIAHIGDGQLDIAGADQESLGTVTYRVPGVYQPTPTLVDSTGNEYTQTVALLIPDQVAQEQTLKKAWNDFANSIAAGDKNAAMAYLSDAAKTKYGAVFDVLRPHLAGIVAGWSAPQTNKLAEKFAEFAINRTIDGVSRLFLIYLLQGYDGVWRIDSM